MHKTPSLEEIWELPENIPHKTHLETVSQLMNQPG